MKVDPLCMQQVEKTRNMVKYLNDLLSKMVPSRYAAGKGRCSTAKGRRQAGRARAVAWYLGIGDGPMHDMLERVRAYDGPAPQGRWENGRWLATRS